ncbi:integrase [Sulfitobacter sp. 1A13679]|uniref:integrase n=1 Tax=Sulfitobacter sp. 1A13679 TaxID=3368597 RepID=UPI0037458CB3
MTNYSEKYSGRFVINSHDKITIRGRDMRLAQKTRNGYVLMNADGTGISETFDFCQLSRLNMAKEIHHEPDFFTPKAAARRSAVSTSRLCDLSTKQRMRLKLRHALVSAFLEMQQESLVKANDRSIEKCMPEICRRAHSYLSDEAPEPEAIQREIDVRSGVRRKTRGGNLVAAVAPVHPRTLRSWLAKFTEFGMNGLADSISNRGNRISYFNAEERALLMRTVKESYLSLNGPWKATTVDDVKIAFRDENRKREEQGLSALRVPSREAVRNAINGLDKFQVVLARKGHAEAVKLFKPVSGGLQVDRPFQRVEIDEWSIDLITHLADSGLLSLFTKEELNDLGLDNKTGRWWITAAIDCRTRCIVGMKLTLNPTTCASLECLRMTTSDKGSWADAVGAVSGWHMAATPETLVSDNGPAFKAFKFTEACNDLKITHELSIAGMPSMRGTIERVFRTAAMNLLPRLNGRTFSSVLERGDHPAEKRACLGPEDLCFALVRWIVDIYHNTPHSGLGGKTPLEQWEDDAKDGNFPLKACPSVRSDRLAFGVEVKRHLDKYGVSVLGIKYHSEALANWYIKFGKQKMVVRWLASDIGCVEVRLGDEWHQLEAVGSGFDGLHAQVWLEARRSLKTSNPAKLKWREDTVCDAISAIREMNIHRSLQFGLITQNWNPERVESAEQNLFCGFNITGSDVDTTITPGQYGRTVQPSKTEAVVVSQPPEPSVPSRSKNMRKKWDVREGDE